MRYIALLTLAAVVLMFNSCSVNSREKPGIPVKIIFDTDLGPDYDDVGALAFLHAMADSGKAEILATVSSNRNELVAPSINVINTYFGRPGLQIGAPKGNGASLGAWQHWPDSIIAKYPHTINSTEEVPDAVEVYRKILSSQPDNSVTIVTVGFLTNLNNLLKSEPDAVSSLYGSDLVRKKVRRLVSMAGRFPEGKEFNIHIDSASSRYVFENWPGDVIFTGFEIGWEIRTGLRLIESPVTNSPVKDVFRISIPMSEEDRFGRMSWDETAVLIAVYGTEGFFDTKRGTIIVHPDGSNSWRDDPDGKHLHVIQKIPVPEMAKFIEDRMMHLPMAKPSGKDDSEIYLSIKPEVLKDKIAGGWAGKMIGVTYGAPTEFRAQGKIYDDTIRWRPSDIKGSIWQDDLYVQLTFLMSMDRYGVDAPARKYQEMFARAGYHLWHANMQARKNYYDSIFPPYSGMPEYNLHADDIDFQIEADYIGFMCPGMPQTALKLADKTGHIMNYGDGFFGGVFVAALYAEAFFESDIAKIVATAMKSLPPESDYYKIIDDVIKLHDYYPADWRTAWQELEEKWGDVDICGAGSPFNIDAKLNGAYIVMGLLYGDGDPLKTLEISTRCGQDSDCNPSNALAVLGVINGFSNLPSNMKDGITQVADSVFIHTDYSFNKAVENTYRYALRFILENGGSATKRKIRIKKQEPAPPEPEVSFPGLIYKSGISVFDKNGFVLKGKWSNYPAEQAGGENRRYQSMFAGNKGDIAEINFKGTGISLNGNWVKDGGKADILVDGKLHRTIDTYYFYSGQQHRNVSLWHITGLNDGDHKVSVVIKGEKRPESEGTRIYLTGATLFTTGTKKNDTYKFSFER